MTYWFIFQESVCYGFSFHGGQGVPGNSSRNDKHACVAIADRSGSSDGGQGVPGKFSKNDAHAAVAVALILE